MGDPYSLYILQLKIKTLKGSFLYTFLKNKNHEFIYIQLNLYISRNELCLNQQNTICLLNEL
jgi:hypothetical protein